MRINLPTKFIINYPKENRKYYNPNQHNKVLKKLLTEASKGYCMYCGNRIVLGGLNYGQLEHSVEKIQTIPKKDVPYLTHCKYNIAIACSICNGKYKNTDVKKLHVNYDYTCNEECTQHCSEYKDNFSNHYDLNKVILMPRGISKNNLQYNIDFNLINLRYEPGILNYTEADKTNINFHINKFDLNGKKRCKDTLIDICTYVIDNKRIPHKNSSINNIVGENFIDYLNEIKNSTSMENVLSICRMILLTFAMKGKRNK
ncbi:hypothetical protein G8V03_11385 [Clostridium botulinum D/C]|uniref:hypothetical protein n=1 Tax=Clostridium botulinum TaxID=1491 RepID=UPI001E295B4F|nr:hypothetical protein [Clostridium botulinum]MCD3351592.1 hypothetical protein [Clostridium botulinum D/C]MCD3360537.1 hypothetical protein [Clostridium botulinum D/C]MCD3362205.1 hypothetical protein [Clostridium botulinum D/C]MCD3366293.1 hypothetical protein [Clostridium botulinum D/C]